MTTPESERIVNTPPRTAHDRCSPVQRSPSPATQLRTKVTARSRPPLRSRRRAPAAVSRTARSRRSLTPPIRQRRVRGVPRMRAPRIRIPACQVRCLLHEKLVAFSYKRRGFCLDRTQGSRDARVAGTTHGESIRFVGLHPCAGGTLRLRYCEMRSAAASSSNWATSTPSHPRNSATARRRRCGLG